MNADGEQRLHELAAAYALGELDDDGLRELYQALRNESTGDTAARLTWERLQLHSDLRNAFDTGFVDQVERRLDDENGGASTFLGHVLAAIGVRRERLRSVRLRGSTPGRHPWRRWFVCLLLAALTAVAIGFWPRQMVAISVLQGPALVDGQTLSASQHRGGIISLDTGARIHVRWRHGAEAQIHGPATCSVHDDGVSLHAGRCRIRTSEVALRVGLPGRPVRVLGGSDCLISSQDEGGVVAVHKGSSQLLAGMQHQSEILVQEQQWSDGGPPAPWLVLADWHGSPAIPAHVCLWQLEFGVFCPEQAAVVVDTADGPLLRVESDSLLLPQSGQRRTLPGPPRQQRDLMLRADSTGIDLYGTGDATPLLTMPAHAPPTGLHLFGRATRVYSELRVGPDILTWHKPDG